MQRQTGVDMYFNLIGALPNVPPVLSNHSMPNELNSSYGITYVRASPTHSTNHHQILASHLPNPGLSWKALKSFAEAKE